MSIPLNLSGSGTNITNDTKDNSKYITIKADHLAEILFEGYKDTYRARFSLFKQIPQIHSYLQAIADSDPREEKYHLEKYSSDMEDSLLYATGLEHSQHTTEEEKALAKKGVWILWRVDDWRRTKRMMDYKKEESEARVAKFNYIKEQLLDILEDGKENPLYSILLSSLPNKPQETIDKFFEEMRKKLTEEEEEDDTNNT